MAGYLDDTRRSYDVSALDYAPWIAGELAHKPHDRAVLSVFAELVDGPVADVGCGTGRLTAHLDSLGVPVFGLDLSPGMVAVARRTGLSFAVASMTALPVADGVLGGILAWYSTIHVPDRDLPGAINECRRALAPGGLLQLAFQVGDHVVHRTRAGGHDVTLDLHHRRPEAVANLLARHGFTIRAVLERAPDGSAAYPEETPQGYILAAATR